MGDFRHSFPAKLQNLLAEYDMTQAELAAKLDVSPNAVHTWVSGKNIPRMDKIEIMTKLFNVPRSYLIGGGRAPSNLHLVHNGKAIPLVGTIAAGSPLLAEQNIRGHFVIDGSIRADFCLRIKGDSMEDEGIYDGDYVYIRKTDTACNGDIVAVLIGEEATLKTFYKTEDTIILRPGNSKYTPIVLTKEDDAIILGKLVGVYQPRE